MAHGLVEATGRAHFRYNPEVSDEELYEQGYNRVYDTLEPETNLDDVEKVMAEVLEQWDPSEILCLLQAESRHRRISGRDMPRVSGEF